MRFITLLLVLASSAAFAQPPRSPCDKLAGAERERCIAEEKAQRDQLGRTETPRKCDRLFGPEKDLCLKKGGTVKTATPPDAR